MDVKALGDGLRKGKFTSADLVNVLGERVYKIGRKLNLTCEENFEEALQMARQRDVEREQARKKGEEALNELSPFHGIPFSVKDIID